MFHGYEDNKVVVLVVEELNRGRIACHAKQKQNQQAWLAIHHHGPWTALTGLEQTVKIYLLDTTNSFAHTADVA